MYRHGYFVWRGASRVEHATRGTARDYLCTRGSTGECTVAIVRTGVALSSLVCWLVILIGAGSSEVGARSAPVGRKRGDWGPSCPPVVKGVCIAVQAERSEAKEQARRTSAQARGRGGGLGSAGGGAG